MAQPDMVGMVVRDMVASLQFYRALGLQIPPDADKEPHVDYLTPGGFRIAWDGLEMIKGIYPDWIEAVGQRMTLAFKCDSPAAVDAPYKRLVGKGDRGHKKRWDALGGRRKSRIT